MQDAEAFASTFPATISGINALVEWLNEDLGDIDSQVLAAETAATNAGVSEDNAAASELAAEQAAAEAVAASLGGSVSPLRYTIDTDSTSASDPGAGVLRFNNATQSSATAIYLDNSTEDAVDLSAYLAALPQSMFLTLVKTTDRAVWRKYSVTAIVDSTGYRTLTVSNLAGAGAFSDEDVAIVTFAANPSISTAPVVTISDADTNLDNSNNGRYARYTNSGAKTVTVRPEEEHALTADGEWSIRNAGDTGDLTIIEDTDVLINAPAGGTLVLEPGMSAMLKRVATDTFDLIGQTVAA